jgi:glucokinase
VNRDTVRVVADVGATNTRLALFDEATAEFHALGTFVNRDYPRLQDVVSRWLEEQGIAPTRACIAIASPLAGDHVAMVNMDWHFSRSAFAEETGLSPVTWINDFVANAYALPHLAASERSELHPGTPGGLEKFAAIGPGTGRGGATVQHTAEGWMATACEPGHAGLSPANAVELAVFDALLDEHDNIYTELLVSGPGLQRLYRTLAVVTDRNAAALSPADISGRALAGEDPLCVESLELFCALLGSACGDFLLSTGARDGLYLAGGIVPRMIPFLKSSSFHQRLCSKGAMGPVLQQVPVYVVTAPQPGLIGAAHAPLVD